MNVRRRCRRCRQFGAAALLSWCGGWSGGCAEPQRATPEPVNDEPAGPATPEGASPARSSSADEALGSIHARQDARAKALRFLESRGVVEFRWKENGQERFEQCDLRLFAVPPDRTAFRLSKLGEQYAWIGSDEQTWWVFRLKDRPSSVEVRTYADAGGEGLSIASPRVVLLVAGLAAFPPLESCRLLPGKDSDGERTVEFTSPAAPGLVQCRIDLRSGLPKAVVLFDRSGGVLLSSSLGDYVSASTSGLATGDWPSVPRKIVVTRETDGATIRLSLDEPTGRGDRIRSQFFEFEDLLRSLRPDEVVYRANSFEAIEEP